MKKELLTAGFVSAALMFGTAAFAEEAVEAPIEAEAAAEATEAVDQATEEAAEAATEATEEVAEGAEEAVEEVAEGTEEAASLEVQADTALEAPAAE